MEIILKKPDNNNLEKVIEGCQRGDNDSFSQLLTIYSTRLYGFFYRLTGRTDIADDLLSRLFVKLVKIIDSYHGGNFDAWLFKVAINVFYDHLRAQKRDKKLLENKQSQLLYESNRSSDNDLADDLQRNLEKLDPEIRELIVNRFYSQLSFKQLAHQRNEPIGTTLSKIHRGLKKLRELMEK